MRGRVLTFLLVAAMLLGVFGSRGGSLLSGKKGELIARPSAFSFSLGFADPSGRYRIGPGSAAGFPLVHQRGSARTGAYVDDTTPHRCYWANWLENKGYWPVLTAIAPGDDPGCPRRIGLLQIKEWYPYGSYGDCSYYWGRLPTWSLRRFRWHAYILQWGFHWDVCAPPTNEQRWKLFWQAKKKKPQLIMLYSGG